MWALGIILFILFNSNLFIYLRLFKEAFIYHFLVNFIHLVVFLESVLKSRLSSSSLWMSYSESHHIVHVLSGSLSIASVQLVK